MHSNTRIVLPSLLTTNKVQGKRKQYDLDFPFSENAIRKGASISRHPSWPKRFDELKPAKMQWHSEEVLKYFLQLRK